MPNLRWTTDNLADFALAVLERGEIKSVARSWGLSSERGRQIKNRAFLAMYRARGWESSRDSDWANGERPEEQYPDPFYMGNMLAHKEHWTAEFRAWKAGEDFVRA